jgi:hypothetical protein
MEFTDVQLELFDTMTDLKLRTRDYPLDEHPVEMTDKHYIIKMITILGHEFYLWNPSPEEMQWTEDKTAAYRYSDTDIGRQTLAYDLHDAIKMKKERGLDGACLTEEING